MSLRNDAISPMDARAPEQGTSALVVDIFERSGALFLCLDTQGRIVRVNPAIAERLDYSEDELLILNFADLMPSERRDDARALLDRLQAGNTVVSAEATLTTRAGDRVYVRGMLSPRIQEGRLTTAFGIFNEQVVAAPLRSTLGVNSNLLDAMLDASPDGIFLFDANETIVAYNRRCLEVWEIEECDVKGGNVRAAMLRRLADPDAFLETVNRLYARQRRIRQRPVPPSQRARARLALGLRIRSRWLLPRPHLVLPGCHRPRAGRGPVPAVGQQLPRWGGADLRH